MTSAWLTGRSVRDPEGCGCGSARLGARGVANGLGLHRDTPGAVASPERNP
jgi:hypothetical protein